MNQILEYLNIHKKTIILTLLILCSCYFIYSTFINQNKNIQKFSNSKKKIIKKYKETVLSESPKIVYIENFVTKEEAEYEEIEVEEEEAEWEDWILAELNQYPKGQLSLGWLEKWPKNLQRRVLRTWLSTLGFEGVPAWIENLLKRSDLLTPSGAFLFRSDTLIFSPEQEFASEWSLGKGPLEIDRRYDLGASRAWSFLPSAPDTEKTFKYSLLMQFKTPSFDSPGVIKLSWENLPWPLALRSPVKSDPLAWMDKLLKEASIPKVYWTQWPVIVSHKTQEVVGLLGLGVLEKYQPKDLARCVCVQGIFEEYLRASE